MVLMATGMDLFNMPLYTCRYGIALGPHKSQKSKLSVLACARTVMVAQLQAEPRL